MSQKLLTFLLFIVISHALSAQQLDTAVYNRLVQADKDQFVPYAKAAGLTTDYDSTAQVLFAKTKGILYSKPFGDKNNNQYYELVLILSTLDKANNKLVLKNAMENSSKKGTWTDDQYLYMEWDTENPLTKEMWYKVLVYRKKK